MRRFLRGLLRPATFLPVLCVGLAFLVGQLALERDTMTIVTRGVVIAMAIAIIMIYTPNLVDMLRAEKTPRDQYLVTGILTMWVSAAAVMIWAIVQLSTGRPAWMMGHWFPNLCFVTFAASGFYFIKLPGASKAGWRYAILVIAIAVVIVTALVVFGASTTL